MKRPLTFYEFIICLLLITATCIILAIAKTKEENKVRKAEIEGTLFNQTK